MDRCGPAVGLPLASMRQLADARDSRDDWTGLKSASERRKLQNRLNVRAHRRRKAGLLKDNSFDRGQYTPITRPKQEHHMKQDVCYEAQPICRGPEFPSLAGSRMNADPLTQRLRWDDINFIELTFRLPVDQRLITLIHYNVLRACATNMSILAVTTVRFSDCNKAETMELFPAPSTVPESLIPTPLQQATPHERWIDLIPVPRMRDNAIRRAGTFDSNELVGDFVGGLYGEPDERRMENNGMLVWADPWHVSGWELTAGFIKKWNFLIEGCHDMIAATNVWRAIRDEDPLILEP